MGSQYKHLNQAVLASYSFSLLYWVFSFAQKEAERREFANHPSCADGRLNDPETEAGQAVTSQICSYCLESTFETHRLGGER
jgi:hypothetical protein